MKKPTPQKVNPEQLARREDIFRVYRDMGPARSYDRLLAAIEKKHGKLSRRTLANWSRQHSWQERIAEYDRDLDTGMQAQLDPNFDKRDALLKAAHLTMMRVLQACPVVKTARDAKALLDAAVTAMKLAEMLRATQENPEEAEERRKHMWDLIDQIMDIKRSQFEGTERNKGVGVPGRPTRRSAEDGSDTDAVA